MGHGCDLAGVGVRSRWCFRRHNLVGARVRRDQCDLGLGAVVRFGVGGCGASGDTISSSAGQLCDLNDASGSVISLMLGYDETGAIWGWGQWCDLALGGGAISSLSLSLSLSLFYFPSLEII